MTALIADDFVAMVSVHLDGDQITHASSGNEKCSFLAEDFRCAGFEPIHRRVFAIHIVADLGCGHGLAHFDRGLGYCVTT